ncbi:DUF6632 domain-containing protein [Pseudonocardia sp. CA-142604]|uniref:DUF6632 domain-containing protein n=1 Tax=Pseudonocardia sp. CA-142604 TaxID=3240024 RepID=UPI003D8BA339
MAADVEPRRLRAGTVELPGTGRCTSVTEEKRTGLLKVVLRAWGVGSILIFGAIFTGYAIQTPGFRPGAELHWLVWDDLPGHVGLMLSGIYLVWAVYTLVAARRPAAYSSFLDFTMWVNIAHGLIMIPGAFEQHYHSKFLTDIPWVLLLSAAIYFLRSRVSGTDAASYTGPGRSQVAR